MHYYSNKFCQQKSQPKFLGEILKFLVIQLAQGPALVVCIHTNILYTYNKTLVAKSVAIHWTVLGLFLDDYWVDI